MHWIVRANKPGVEAMDFNGLDVVLNMGQRGLLPRDEALSAAQNGSVEMLSPDGVEALANAPARVEPEPVRVEPAPAQDKPAVPADDVAGSRIARGPQLKRRTPTIE